MATVKYTHKQMIARHLADQVDGLLAQIDPYESILVGRCKYCAQWEQRVELSQEHPGDNGICHQLSFRRGDDYFAIMVTSNFGCLAFKPRDCS